MKFANGRPVGVILMAIAVPLLLGGLLFGCMSAQHQQELGSTEERETTIGIKGQKEIRIGMPQEDIASALGSPNIVKKDEAGKETWIYEKIATSLYYKNDRAGLPGSALILYGVGEGHSKSVKTFTLIIKFDDRKKAESFSYRLSKS